MIDENKIIIDNFSLINNMALGFPYRDREDYIQVGRIGVLKAIRSFNPKRAKFTTHATNCVRNEMIREYNRHQKYYSNNIHCSLDHIIMKPEPTPLELDMLTRDERLIVDMRLNNESYRKIAHELGCSRNKVRRMLTKIGYKI